MFNLSGRKNRIFLVSSQSSSILAATCFRKRGRFHIGRVQKMGKNPDLRCGSCRILLHSPQTSILQDYFPKSRPEILEMMLDDRIREEGFLAADASLSHAFTVTGSTGKKQQLLVVSLPSQLVETAFDIIEESRVRRLRSVTPVPAALSALMGRVTEKPVMAVIMRNSSCEFLVCHRGLPLMMQASPVEHDSPDAPAMLLEGMKAVARRALTTHNINLENVLLLGHGIDYSSIVTQGFHVLKPDISRFVSAENPADLTSYPEFAGALLAGSRLDYVPRIWRLSCGIQDAACYAALAAGMAALFMAGAAFNIQKDVDRYRTSYTEQYRKVSRASVQVLGMLPDSKEKAGLEKLMGYWKQNLREARLDDTLLKIAEALPPGTQIDHFRAWRKGTPDSARTSPAAVPPARSAPYLPVAPVLDPSPEAAPAEPAFSAPMAFEMDVITRGEFTDARTRFEHSVEKLRKWFIITDITWEYDQDTSMGVMKCSFEMKHREETS